MKLVRNEEGYYKYKSDLAHPVGGGDNEKRRHNQEGRKMAREHREIEGMVTRMENQAVREEFKIMKDIKHGQTEERKKKSKQFD